MAKIPRARYSPELKREAVQMAIDEGFGVSATARQLAIPMNTLANWVVQYRQDAQGFATGPGISEQEAELTRLRKENVLLRMERDILKKAAAYFAKESL
jgi:transposase